MKYLVMECHPAYAVVLDEKGRFLKVANLNYEPGQTVSSVIEMKPRKAARRFGKWLVAAASLASSLLILFFGAWQFLLVPYGSVRLQINPDVLISVNRLDYVVGVEGLNQDGEDLVADFEYRFKKLEAVTDELADLAIKGGYLSDGGTIWLDVRSSHESWKQEAQERLILSLDDHLGGTVRIATGVPEENEDDIPPSESETSSQPETGFSPESIVIPAAPPSQETTAPESKPQTPPAVNIPSEEDDDKDDDPDHDDDDGEADDEDDDDDGKADDEDD